MKVTASVLWIAMLVGFIVAVFWVIATVVFIRGFKHWAYGHDEIKPIEAEEDLIDEVLGR